MDIITYRVNQSTGKRTEIALGSGWCDANSTLLNWFMESYPQTTTSIDKIRTEEAVPHAVTEMKIGHIYSAADTQLAMSGELACWLPSEQHV